MATRDQRELLPLTTILDSTRILARLPDWLVDAIREEHVRRVLNRSIPEFATGRRILHNCVAKHLLLSEDGLSWTGSYYLTIGEPGSVQSHMVHVQGTLLPPHQAAPETAVAVGTFGSDEWCQYIPALRMVMRMHPPDTQLAVLPDLTDPARARALLEQSMRSQAPAYREVSILSCHPHILRYHPGLRCTIRYDVTCASDSAVEQQWPAFVIAKTYDGDKGQNAYTCMRALWNSPLSATAAVQIAEPLAYLPELQLLVQGPIPGEQTLQALLASALDANTPAVLAELDASMRKAAVGLVALHNAGVNVGMAYRWEDELAGVRAFFQRLATAVPELAQAALPVFSCLETLATTCPPDPPVPAHGTFRPSQVLLNRGQPGFIDFDSFCQAEPAMDLARFRVATMDMGMSALQKQEAVATDPRMDHDPLDHLIQLEAIADRFLAHYAALRPVSRPRIALWEALHIFELVIRSWDRVKPRRLNHTILMLERNLRAQCTYLGLHP